MARETIEQTETEIVETTEETIFYICDGCGMDAQKDQFATYSRTVKPTRHSDNIQHELHFCEDCLDADRIEPLDLAERLDKKIPFIDPAGPSKAVTGVAAAGWLISVGFFPAQMWTMKFLFGNILYGVVAVICIAISTVVLDAMTD